MITNWIKNILAPRPEQISRETEANELAQGASAYRGEVKLTLDEQEAEKAALTREAQQRNLELMSIIQKGGVPMERLPLQLHARRKVKNAIQDFYDLDEITEKVIERIEADSDDPFLKKFFS